jgi:hypothetical protein
MMEFIFALDFLGIPRDDDIEDLSEFDDIIVEFEDELD